MKPFPRVIRIPGIRGKIKAMKNPAKKYRIEEINDIKSHQLFTNLVRVCSNLSIPLEISSLEIV